MVSKTHMLCPHCIPPVFHAPRIVHAGSDNECTVWLMYTHILFLCVTQALQAVGNEQPTSVDGLLLLTTSSKGMAEFAAFLGPRLGKPYLGAYSMYYIVLFQLFGTLPGQHASARKVSKARAAVLTFLVNNLLREAKLVGGSKPWARLLWEEMSHLKAVPALPFVPWVLAEMDPSPLLEYVNTMMSEQSTSSGSLSQLLALQCVYANTHPFRLVHFSPCHSSAQQYQQVLPREDDSRCVREILIGHVERNWMRNAGGVRVLGAQGTLTLDDYVAVEYPEECGVKSNTPMMPVFRPARPKQPRAEAGRSVDAVDPPAAGRDARPSVGAASQGSAYTSTSGDESPDAAVARAAETAGAAATAVAAADTTTASGTAAATTEALGAAPATAVVAAKAAQPHTASTHQPQASTHFLATNSIVAAEEPAAVNPIPLDVASGSGQKRSACDPAVGSSSMRPPHRARKWQTPEIVPRSSLETLLND